MRILTPGLRILLVAACTVLLIGGLKLAHELLIPVALAYFLAILNLPITRFLTARGIPNLMAVIMTVLMNLLILSLAAVLFVSVIDSFQARSTEYVAKLESKLELWIGDMFEKYESMQESGRNAEDPANKGVVPRPEAGLLDGESADEEVVRPAVALPEAEETQKTLLEILDLQAREILTFINDSRVVQYTASLLSRTFFIFIVMVFILMEAPDLGRRLARIDRANGPNLRHLARASLDIQRYLGIKSAVSLATGILAFLFTWLLGLQFPMLWGLIAFLLNFIPAIGSIIASIPPALFALIQFGWWQMSFVLIGYFVINMLLGNFIEPMLLGNRFGISTLVVILSVVFWGWLWGPVGMFLAVPLTMMIKVMLDTTEEFRWLSVAMSKDAAPGRNRWLRHRRRTKGSSRSKRLPVPTRGSRPQEPAAQPPAAAPEAGAPNR